ncbi:universal stress protein, partial [Streptococcus agalactiae]
MSQKYERILVAIDGSTESELAFEKAVNVALRNDSELILTHVIDTRALQSFATFDTYIYEKLEKEAKDVLEEYEKQAREKGA